VKLIAGLGNPGPRFVGTRHNVGFMVVDELARRWRTSAGKYERRWEAQLGEGYFADQRVLLLKPQTYMNLSGRSVLAVQQFYKLELSDLMVVCDDMALPTGRLRMRASGTGGGQKGLENILLRLSSVEIARLRIGIGQAPSNFASEYVTGRFSPQQREQIETAITSAADAIECWLSKGIDAAMTRYNAGPGDRKRGKNQPAKDETSEGESS
jgi:PTH1 family peptidyl-tRNA hydrolase